MESALPSFDLSALPRSELEHRFGALEDRYESALELICELKERLVEALEQLAQAKGLKGRPKLKPSGMEQASASRRRREGSKKPSRKGSKTAKLKVDEVRTLKVSAPADATFKGYEDYVVQDLVVCPWVIRFRRERWVTAEGKTLVAPLPPGVEGHYGAEVRRFALALYHQGQITMPRLMMLLQDIGIKISKRQVVRLLNERNAPFHEEAREILRAGLRGASWIAVDDTGARHKCRNGFCTEIGNEQFAWYGTTLSKSRLNFLTLLRAGYSDYLVNQAALSYMSERQMPKALIARLAGHETKRFPDQANWLAHLSALAIPARKAHPDPVTIASEGATWAAVLDHGFLCDAVILSDDAGQFNVGLHALCWVHGERTIYKLHAVSQRQVEAKEQVRCLIWQLYADLKDYRLAPTTEDRASLEARFELIFKRRTRVAMLDRALARLHANKHELLVVLDRPEVPLHTNGTENDMRSEATKRKISGGTRSDLGRDARNTHMGLCKTCQKQGISYWSYLGDRLKVEGAPAMPYLPDLVAQKTVPP